MGMINNMYTSLYVIIMMMMMMMMIIIIIIISNDIKIQYTMIFTPILYVFLYLSPLINGIQNDTTYTSYKVCTEGT
jgi:hypothetical protein